MECKGERQIRRAAIFLLQAGWCTGAERSTAPEGLRPLLDHAGGCLRCRELLEIFLETERRLQEMIAAEDQGAAGARVLQLLPISDPSRGPEATEDAAGYDLAADSGGPQAPDAPMQTRTLTLVTHDDRYLVRIIDAPEGATAVLVPFQNDPADTEAGRHPALRIGEAEYAFDDSGVVRLPVFPGEAVTLILH